MAETDPPNLETPPEDGPLAAIYGCMKDVTVILPGVDLTAPTGELWLAEEAEEDPKGIPQPEA